MKEIDLRITALNLNELSLFNNRDYLTLYCSKYIF